MNQCPDCALPLVWSTDLGSGRSGVGPSGLSGLEASPDLVVVRAADLGWIRSLVARLAQAGIRSFISIVADPSLAPEQLAGMSFNANWDYFLFVRPEDLEASAEVDRALLAEQLSEVESLGGFAAVEADACPACGARRPEDAEKCPSCELQFRWPTEEETDVE